MVIIKFFLKENLITVHFQKFGIIKQIFLTLNYIIHTYLIYNKL